MKWVNDYKVVWTTTLSPLSLQVATVSLGAISSFNQELLDGLNGLLHTFPPGYSRSYTSMINAYLEMSWVYTHLITFNNQPSFSLPGMQIIGIQEKLQYVWSSRWWTERPHSEVEEGRHSCQFNELSRSRFLHLEIKNRYYYKVVARIFINYAQHGAKGISNCWANSCYYHRFKNTVEKVNSECA